MWTKNNNNNSSFDLIYIQKVCSFVVLTTGEMKKLLYNNTSVKR